MIGGMGAGRPAVAPRPQLRVCYLCGQQFGSASIGIHIPQCYAKKLAQWEVGDLATRGSKPKHPDTVNWKGTGKTSKQLNDDQFQEFNANLVPCPNCGRTFLPDRLPVHQRGCNAKPGAGGAPALTKTSTSPGGGGGGATGRAPSRGSSVSRRSPGVPLLLPTCYLCGQQFGTASIGIHIPQCYAKRFAQWEAADPATRGRAPRHPDTVQCGSAKGGPAGPDGAAVGGSGGGRGGFTAAVADAQFQEFVSSLEPCPNCGRKFFADRLAVHLRSCRPGHTARPVHAPLAAVAASEGGEEERGPRQGSPAPKAADRSPPKPTAGGAGGPAPSAPLSEELDRVNPMRNRVPKAAATTVGAGRTCPQCEAVEHDAAAKYCRECGWNLNSRQLAEPCARCGERVPEGSRFCGTCGEPVNGAAADERAAGGENANAPTVRLTGCPACRAVCDADGNFCDNCGAALGGAEPEPGLAAAAGPPPRFMYCAVCAESTEDLHAVYCEECGGRLEMRERAVVSECSGDVFTGRPVDTLRPGSSRGGTAPRPKPSKRPPAVPSGGGASASASAGESTKVVADPVAPPDAVDTAVMEVDLVECPTCGRRFASDVLERHGRVCSKQQKKRPTFNMTKQRLADCDGVPTQPSSSAPTARAGGRGLKPQGSGDGAALAPPKKNWRAESEAFRAALRDARRVDEVMKSGGNARDLPPPTYSENAHYLPCPHCGRRFAPDVAERHIPRCATTINRPKPPPRRR